MGKKRMAALMVALCVCLCLGLASCGTRSDMERGAWQGDTFVNSWAGVSFTRPAELALDELLRRISGAPGRADHVAVIATPQLVPGER